jgi:hypothetical protein
MAQEEILKSGKIQIAPFKAMANEAPAFVTFSGTKYYT